MLYDRLANSVERLPALRHLFPLVSRARLFRLDAEHATVPPPSRDEIDRIEAAFFLPFRVVVIDDGERVALLSDFADDVQGLRQPRSFVLLLDVDLLVSEWAEQGENMPDALFAIFSSAEKPRIIAEGTVNFDGLESGDRGFIFRQSMSVQQIWYADDRVEDAIPLIEHGVPHRWDGAALGQTIGEHLNRVFNEITVINTPARFVLESSPLKSRAPKRGRILRSHQRPIYTILEPGRIRQLMNLPAAEHGGPKKRPHERRRHVRHLKSERFKDMRGKSIVIPATWIGPSEAVANSRRYLVILD